MVKRKKENKEVEDNADRYESYESAKAKDDKADVYIYAKPKPNKKLDKLWDEVAAKWNQLDKFLTEQGLGQGNRKKVVVMVNELDAIKTKILEEKE